MRLLLDTHALLWWLADADRLGHRARSLVSDPANTVLVSVASLWEIVVKRRVGKLRADVQAVERALVRDGFERLGITAAHLAALDALPMNHRDPFDHLLLAQAHCEAAVLVSDDRRMALYAVQLLPCSGN